MTDTASPEALNAHRPSRPTALFLVGFMGAGKTTVGRELARRLGWSFVDLDDRIEATEGSSVAAVFAQSGEHGFRAVEADALAAVVCELSVGLHAVVALGGGAFVQPANAEAIRATRLPVVFLDAGVEELRRRCAPKGSSRPLFRDEAAFTRLYHARRSSYMQADFRVDTTGKSVPAVADEIANLFGEINS